MPARKRNREINIVGISALDVFCNTVGVLAFMLLLFAVVTIDLVISARPKPPNPIVNLTILTARNLPNAIVGQHYDLALSASGGVAPLRWKTDETRLPGNLQFNPNEGRLNGLPNLAGEYTFFVDVEDSPTDKSQKQTATASFRLNILPAEKAPSKLSLLWQWLLLIGIMLLILVQQFFLFILSRRQSAEVQGGLRKYNVRMIIEPDGQQGLSGNPPAVKEAQQEFEEINKNYRRLKTISWGALAFALAVYIGWVFTMI